MPLPQTVVAFQRPGARGMIANAETRNLISRSLVVGAPAMLFGVPVYRGTTDDLCTHDNAVGDFLGLSRRSGTSDPKNAVVDSFAASDEVPIMTQGVMWVETADAVVAGVPANYDKSLKLWTDAAVAGNVIAVPGAEFDTATTAAGLAKVRVQRIIPA
jgi:hypothetical protein